MRETGCRADAGQRTGQSPAGNSGRHQCPLQVPETFANCFCRLGRRAAAEPAG